MNPTDMILFSEQMMVLGVIYSKPIHQILIEMFWHALKEFDFKLVKEGIQAHIKHADDGKYFPKPADIRRYIEGGSISRSLQAWTKVVQAIHNPGPDTSVIFDDALIHAVLQDMGGWRVYLTIKETELSFRAKEFGQRYETYLLRPPHCYPRQLIGEFEHQNAMAGYTSAPPLLLGDTQKALDVYQQGSDSIQRNKLLPVLSNKITMLAAPSTLKVLP